jgi:betaine-aldehyde dehydrogenase
VPDASTETFHNFIGGKQADATDGRTSPIVDPSTGEVYAEAPLSGPGDVDAACSAAASAFETWRGTTPSDRQRMLLTPRS